jgi:hypothetical protein
MLAQARPLERKGAGFGERRRDFGEQRDHSSIVFRNRRAPNCVWVECWAGGLR